MNVAINEAQATEAQARVLEFVTNHFLENGTSPTVRKIAEAVGSKSANDIQKKVEILIRKNLLVADEYTDEGGRRRYRAGSLKPANWQELRGTTVVSQKEENSGFGENFAFVIMGKMVAFMFFNDTVKTSDVVALSVAIGYCDNFKIPAGTNAERLTQLAPKFAAKALKPVPPIMAEPAPKPRRTKKS